MFSKKPTVRLPNTLTFQLTSWYASMFVTFILFALIVSFFAINSILNDRVDEDLIEDIKDFQLLHSSSGLQSVIQEIGREAGSSNVETVVLQLLNNEGDTLFASDLTHWPELMIDQEILKRLSLPDSEPILETQNIASQEYPTRVIYGLIGSNAILQIGESFEETADIMELILTVFAMMLLMVIPIASGIGWLIARKAVRGIEAVSRAAIDIRRGEFDRRVSVETHTAEIRTLVDTFNSMATRIRNLMSEMREMIDNIAHDLRSPMARIRAIAETMLADAGATASCRAAAADIIDECDRLITLINTTLDVAEAEADVAHTVLESVDLSTLVAGACELFEALAEKKQITLSYEVEPGCKFRGNKQNLQRMLANLLDNALKYTPAKGTVQINLLKTPDGMAIVVADTGIGIPEPEQQRVFDRFYRCDQSRSEYGCGLGLSFARAVARAHRGDIGLSSSPGYGSRFTVTLPHSLT